MRLLAGRRLQQAADLLDEAHQAETGGGFAEAERLARQAAALYGRAAGPGAPETAGALVTVSRTLQAQGRPAEAERDLRAALAAGGPKPDAEALLRTALATLLRRAGRHPEAVEEIGRALAVDASPARAVRARHVSAALLAELGRHREAAEQYAEAATTARREHDGFTLVAESNRLTELAYLGEHEAVERGAARLRAESVRASGPEAGLTRGSADNSLAMSLTLRGRHADAETLLRRVLAAPPDVRQFALILHVNLSRALLGQGRTEEARTALDTARAVADRLPAPSDTDRSALDLATARLHLAEDDPAAAERAARAGLALCPAGDRPTHRALELRTVLGTAEARQGSGNGTLEAALADWEAYFGTGHHGAAAARAALAG
ncbi:tetratricopeptide repeat protein [Kitasatospora fiedleri]|uniref:tetratricopeptide repeat protein n=1 Tax=Kitasatospora fiedleri TaxID=2991545 RepID=UPI00249AB015|nr:tetratricopeptide repeat protein [Kitasatospora fiedleri]